MRRCERVVRADKWRRHPSSQPNLSEPHRKARRCCDGPCRERAASWRSLRLCVKQTSDSAAPNPPHHPAPVLDQQHDHSVRPHAIAQHIGPDGHDLPPPFPRIAPALGKFGQAFGHFDQPRTQSPRGGGVEGFDVVDNCFEVGNGLVGPDDLPQAGRPGSVAGLRAGLTVATAP